MSVPPPRWQGPALLLATVLVLTGLWAARAWSNSGVHGAFQMPPEVVRVVTVRAQPWRATSTLPANLTAIAAIDVRVEVGGRLTDVGFGAGQAVDKGHVLARLDGSNEQAELHAVQANLRAITLRRDRVAQLVAEGGAARMDLDQLTADAEATEARADALRARLRQKVVVAPFAGRAGVRHHHPGQVVDPGTPLTTLVSASSAVFVDVWVPQTLLPSLPVGTVVVVQLHEAVADATIEMIEPVADVRRRAVLVRARLDPAPEGWLPGMSAQVIAPTSEELPRVLVPASALQWSPAGALVYRVVQAEDGGQTVTANVVSVLSNLGDEVVLDGGLDDGATIVTDGAFKLREGATIKLAEATP